MQKEELEERQINLQKLEVHYEDLTEQDLEKQKNSYIQRTSDYSATAGTCSPGRKISYAQDTD